MDRTGRAEPVAFRRPTLALSKPRPYFAFSQSVDLYGLRYGRGSSGFTPVNKSEFCEWKLRTLRNAIHLQWRTSLRHFFLFSFIN